MISYFDNFTMCYTEINRTRHFYDIEIKSINELFFTLDKYAYFLFDVLPERIKSITKLSDNDIKTIIEFTYYGISHKYEYDTGKIKDLCE